MNTMKNLLGGLTGAVTLNVLHELYRRIDPLAPRVDLVGKEALTKTVEATGHTAPRGKKLYLATLVGDILSNSIYYAVIGQGRQKNLLLRGAALGLAAGIGALKLSEPIGLDNTPISKSTRTKVLTVAWYLAGGLVAALVLKKLRDKES
jgi:hypothetical protein